MKNETLETLIPDWAPALRAAAAAKHGVAGAIQRIADATNIHRDTVAKALNGHPATLGMENLTIIANHLNVKIFQGDA